MNKPKKDIDQSILIDCISIQVDGNRYACTLDAKDKGDDSLSRVVIKHQEDADALHSFELACNGESSIINAKIINFYPGYVELMKIIPVFPGASL